jgi:short-subunit dehydrogenase
METKKHRGETALITGATDGIGLELARCCAKDGYNVILVARNQNDLERTAQELTALFGIKAYGIATDLMEPDSAFKLYEEIKIEGIQVDVLINDAGQGVYGAFTGTDVYREIDIVQLNITSLTILTKLFLKDMVMRDSGKILQVASIAAKSSSPYMAVYGGTKAYIYNFTQALISELKDSRVTVTALLPGPTDTGFFDKAGAKRTVMVQEGTLADPAEVAKEGYMAMQSGESKVVSGWKNKMQAAVANFITDETVANMAKKQHELSDKV